MIKVCIFEDNTSLRNGLQQLVDGKLGFECVGAYSNCSDILKHIARDKPDVVLMDIGMPGINGIEGVRILREKFPLIKVLMQTVFEDDDKIFQSICAGASGYILKNTSTARIMEAIVETHNGGAAMSPTVAIRVLKMLHATSGKSHNNSFNLTLREKEVLLCLVNGMSYKLIANHCFISIDTVRSHISNIYEKLHVHSKSQAVAKAIKGHIV